MTQNHMTRWIEIADARHFFEAAPAGRMPKESHFLHLGTTIVKISSWIKRGIHPSSSPVVAN
jgi:hypothetical protein